MQRIEFIGAPYVGKSTLYRGLNDIRSIEKGWKTEEEWRKFVRKEMNYLVFIYRKILSVLIGAVGGNYHVYNYTANEHLTVDVLKKYQYTLRFCFHPMGTENGIAQSHKTYLKMLALISRYSFYESFKKNHALVLEEGILQWHAVFRQALMNPNFNVPEEYEKDPGLFPDGVICCYSDAKILKSRIILRQKNNEINRDDLHLSIDEILAKTLIKQEVCLRYGKLAESKGVKVLYVNTANDLNSSVLEIQKFLEFW